MLSAGLRIGRRDGAKRGTDANRDDASRVAIVAPPGSGVPMIVGSLTFGVTIIAVAAFPARETYPLRLEDLGNRNASPISEAEYERIRLEAMAGRR